MASGPGRRRRSGRLVALADRPLDRRTPGRAHDRLLFAVRPWEALGGLQLARRAALVRSVPGVWDLRAAYLPGDHGAGHSRRPVRHAPPAATQPSAHGDDDPGRRNRHVYVVFAASLVAEHPFLHHRAGPLTDGQPQRQPPSSLVAAAAVRALGQRPRPVHDRPGVSRSGCRRAVAGAAAAEGLREPRRPATAAGLVAGYFRALGGGGAGQSVPFPPLPRGDGAAQPDGVVEPHRRAVGDALPNLVQLGRAGRGLGRRGCHRPRAADPSAVALGLGGGDLLRLPLPARRLDGAGRGTGHAGLPELAADRGRRRR